MSCVLDVVWGVLALGGSSWAHYLLLGGDGVAFIHAALLWYQDGDTTFIIIIQCSFTNSVWETIIIRWICRTLK